MQAEFHLRRERANRLDFGYSKNGNTGLHFHSQIEICFVLEGEVGVWINDRYRVLRAGQLALSCSYDAHAYRAEGDSRFAYLIVPTDLLHEFAPLFAGRHGGDPFICDPEVFDRAYHAFCALREESGEMTVRGYIYVILGILSGRLVPDKREETCEPRSLAQVLMYISEHYRSDLSLSALAASFGYNPSYLSRSFRETLGIGFHRYITMLRLRRAILLMRDGGQSVTACALESGFGSLRSFYRAFYEEFRCTPRQYLSGTHP